VCMGQEYGVDGGRVEGEGFAVFILVPPLVEPAVDHEPGASRLKDVVRTGHFPGGTQYA